MARRPEHFGSLIEDKRWERLDGKTGHAMWTDDYSNLLSILNW